MYVNESIIGLAPGFNVLITRMCSQIIGEIFEIFEILLRCGTTVCYENRNDGNKIANILQKWEKTPKIIPIALSSARPANIVPRNCWELLPKCTIIELYLQFVVSRKNNNLK
jgi:hypothetical protein